jgi:NADPH-dependent 2,4-dienoyl-CoA reductase/sulfur reductase-like enzyme
MEVHLIELAGHVLPPLDDDLAAKISEHLEAGGVHLHLGAQVKGFEGANGSVFRVVTSDGDVEADMVVLSIGIRPVSELAQRAGVELGSKGAVKVDGGMRTNLPDILACGDCATTHHLLTGQETWIPLGSTARKQGRVAAETASGQESIFPGVLGTFILKTFEITVGKTGLGAAEAAEAGFEVDTVTLEDSVLPGYYRGGGRMTARITVEKSSGRLLGAQVIGDVSSVADKRLDIFAVCASAGLTASDLASLDLAYAPPYSHPLDVPIVAGNLAEAKVLGKTCFCTMEGLED